MKLNGWQRIGVIASILWGIGGGIYERMGQVRFANDLLALSINHCLPANADACVELAYKTYANLISLDLAGGSNIVFFSVGPIFAGWIAAYLAVKIFRWVKAGF